MQNQSPEKTTWAGGVAPWLTQLLLWESQMLDHLQKQRADAGARSHIDPNSIPDNNQTQDSTPVPPIRITKSTRRLIPEGEYREVLCVNGYHHWIRRYKRFEAVVEFVFEPPFDGPPIPMHIRLGDSSVAPELPDHHWLYDLLLKLDPSGAINLAVLKGHYFDVAVRTIKGERGEKERDEKHWYSRVSRMALSEGFREMEAQEAQADAEL